MYNYEVLKKALSIPDHSLVIIEGRRDYDDWLLHIQEDCSKGLLPKFKLDKWGRIIFENGTCIDFSFFTEKEDVLRLSGMQYVFIFDTYRVTWYQEQYLRSCLRSTKYKPEYVEVYKDGY